MGSAFYSLFMAGRLGDVNALGPASPLDVPYESFVCVLTSPLSDD